MNVCMWAWACQLSLCSCCMLFLNVLFFARYYLVWPCLCACVHVKAVFMRCTCVCMRGFPVLNVLVLVMCTCISDSSRSSSRRDLSKVFCTMAYSVVVTARCLLSTHTYTNTNSNTLTVAVAIAVVAIEKNMYFEISSTTNSILCQSPFNRDT